MSWISPRSKGTNATDDPAVSAASALVSFRAIAMARYPELASRRTIARPRPRLPPVTTTLRIAPRELAALRDRQRRDEADRGRNLVPRQSFTAEMHDLALELVRSS